MVVKRQKDVNLIVCPNCRIAKKALKDAQIHYRRLFETVHDGILILNGETGNIIDANLFMINMLGYSREELLCMKLWEHNMQIISSLLRLQSKYIREKQYHVLFEESQNMIRSMSLIHEKLYNSRDLSRIDFKDYINDLVNNLFRSYDVNGYAIRSRIDIEDISPGMDMAIRQNNSNIYELFVGDNGVGISNDLDINNTDSLGLRLVKMLVNDQLEGDIDLKRDNGTNFSIKFKGKN